MRDLAISRASGPLSTWLVSSAAAVCVASTAPSWSGGVQWELGLVDAALAGAALILALFLVAMVRLAIFDWLAERRSRRAWTAIGARADEVATAPSARDVSKAAMLTLRSRTPWRYGTSCTPIVMPSL